MTISALRDRQNIEQASARAISRQCSNPSNFSSNFSVLVDANFLYTEQTPGHFSPSKSGLGGGRGRGGVVTGVVGLSVRLDFREHFR